MISIINLCINKYMIIVTSLSSQCVRVFMFVNFVYLCKHSLTTSVYTVLKKSTHLACYNYDKHEEIFIIFGRNFTKTLGNQKVLYFSTSSK